MLSNLLCSILFPVKYLHKAIPASVHSLSIMGCVSHSGPGHSNPWQLHSLLILLDKQTCIQALLGFQALWIFFILSQREICFFFFFYTVKNGLYMNFTQRFSALCPHRIYLNSLLWHNFFSWNQLHSLPQQTPFFPLQTKCNLFTCETVRLFLIGDVSHNRQCFVEFFNPQ